MKFKATVLAGAIAFGSAAYGVHAMGTNSEEANKNTQSAKISIDEAKSIALKEVDGKVIDVDQDQEGSYVVYEVEVQTQNGEKDIEINGQTGKVLKDDDDLLKEQAKITTQEAETIALGKVSGEMTDLDLDYDDRTAKVVYEVEVTHNGLEQDVKIDAVTGDVLHVQKDDDDDDRDDDLDDDNIKSSQVKVTEQKAEGIALKEVDGEVVSIELDEDDGIALYEIEVQSNKGEAEVTVSATNGDVLEVEWDD
ncbi:PepSY domain-containing protein [Priestia endophytica]|uniref:PepSY domain-containing protein n=1 Tax=Priestia endophytica TaxID=135735 RepID=UPI0018CDADFD|nr:PepSY domain-containing protein [Priestia endophytica]